MLCDDVVLVRSTCSEGEEMMCRLVLTRVITQLLPYLLGGSCCKQTLPMFAKDAWYVLYDTTCRNPEGTVAAPGRR